MMDNILLITILTIFVTAIVGALIRFRTRDKCLLEFAGYLTTVELKTGQRYRGVLRVYFNGIELVYTAPWLAKHGQHFETSMLFFQEHLAHTLMLKRMHDELTPENRARRMRELNKTYHPNFARRCRRRLRNAFNLLRDAVGQAFTASLGQLKKTNASSAFAAQDARLNATAQQLLGSAAAAYEPMLEKYIGRKVVLELTQNDQIISYCGVLKEYSDKYVVVLDVPVLEEQEFRLMDTEQLKTSRVLGFELEPVWPDDPAAGVVTLKIKLRNSGVSEVEVLRVTGANYQRDFQRRLAVNETLDLTLTDIPAPEIVVAGQSAEDDTAQEAAATTQRVMPELNLVVRLDRRMDLVTPRALSAVRHGGERVTALTVQELADRLLPKISLPNLPNLMRSTDTTRE